MSKKGDKVKKRAVYVGVIFLLIILILFFVSKFAIKDFKEFFGFEFKGKEGRVERSEIERALMAPGDDCANGNCIYVDNRLNVDCLGGNYNIATRACDGGDGVAYNTIQKAANVAVAGDSVYVRGGVYHEKVSPQNSGAPNSHISYFAYPGEKPVIDASISLFSWTKCTSQTECLDNPNWQNIYYTSIPEGIYPLGSVVYEDNQILKLAQDPNQPDEFLYDDRDYFIFVNTSLGMDIDNYSIKDPNYFNQPDSSYWEQAYVAVWGGNNNVAYKKIDSYNPIDNRINFTKLPYSAISNHDKYSILNHILALDTPGEYYVDNSSERRIYLWPKTSGVEGKNITFSTLTEGFSLSGRGYIRIEGFEIVKQAAASLTDWYGGVGIINPTVGAGVYSNLIIRNNIIGKGKGPGIFLYYCDYCVVEGNYIYDQYGKGILLSNQNYSVIRNNTLKRLAGTGIDYYFASFSNISDNKLSYIGGHHANGLTVYRESDNVFVERNIVTDSNIAFTFQSSVNITLRNNIFVGYDESRVIAGWNGLYKGGRPYGINILNNIAINSTNNAALYLHRDFTNITVKNNILDGGDNLTGIEHSNNVFTGLTWNQRDNLTEFNEILETNLSRIFVDWMNGDFRLVEGSPAIDNGTPVPVFDDFDGNVRPSGAGWDIGAYEYISQDSGGCPSGYASNVSQYNITWNFDKCYKVGQFVNGDWWVVGPVNIINVTPAPTGIGVNARHGSMVNPVMGDDQAYDGRGAGYNSSRSISFPYQLLGNQSLFSTESRPENDSPRLDLFGTYIDLYKTKLIGGAVLTRLDAAVSNMTFRPPFSGNIKPLFTSQNLRTDKLLNLTPAGGTLALNNWRGPETAGNTYARYFERPCPMHKMGDTGDNIKPLDNCYHYYASNHRAESDVALLLLTNIPNKTQLLINFIQKGIDDYYTIQTYPNPPRRGDRVLSKWPIIFAGIMLDNEEMQHNINYGWFKTDAGTYSGNGWTGATALWRNDNRASLIDESYNYEHLNPFSSTPYVDGWCSISPTGVSVWRDEGYRRATHSWTWVGTALAAQLMNAKEIWNHSAFFGYTDRWMGYNQPSEDEKAGAGLARFNQLNALAQTPPNGQCDDGQNAQLLYSQSSVPGDSFVENMWSMYRNFTSACGNGICNATLGENCSNCAADCGICLDTTPPVLSNIRNGSVTNSSAVILWSTNENANGTIIYGVTTILGSNASHTNFVQSHSVSLNGLQNSTLYYYRVRSCDSSGNCNQSSLYNFTTLAAYVDVFGPTVILQSPGNATSVGSNSVTFRYTPSDFSAIANCSIFVNGAATVDNATENGIENSFSVNLENKEYYWNISCTDNYGNIGESETWKLIVNYIAPADTGTPSSSNGGSGSGISPKPIAKQINITNESVEIVGGEEKIILGEELSFIEIKEGEEAVIIDLYGNSYKISFALSEDGNVLARVLNGDYIIPRGEVLPIGLGREEMFVGIVESNIDGAKIVMGLNKEKVIGEIGEVEEKAVEGETEGRGIARGYYVLFGIVGLLIAAIIVWVIVGKKEKVQQESKYH